MSCSNSKAWLLCSLSTLIPFSVVSFIITSAEKLTFACIVLYRVESITPKDMQGPLARLRLTLEVRAPS